MVMLAKKAGRILVAAILGAMVVLVAGCPDATAGVEEMTAYVSPAGSAGNSGLYPGEPKETIVEGIAVAQANGLHLVKIARGIYVINSTINIVAGVSLEGGYSTDFASRSYSNLSQVVLMLPAAGILVDGSAITNATVIDGLTLINDGSGTGTLGIVLDNSAAPTISNNTINLADGSATSGYVQGLVVNYSGEVGSPVISGNTITVRKTTSTGTEGIRGIMVWNMASGSGLLIGKNRVVARGNVRTDGVRFMGVSGAIVKNNVVSVEATGSGDSYAIVADNSSDLVVSNNTVCATDSVANKAGFLGNATSAEVFNNIFCSQISGGMALMLSGTIHYGWNLVFNYSTLATGGINSSNNTLYTTDLFSSVFTGARDTDLSDGDSTDYHLTDFGGLYACNLGTNTGVAMYGNVSDDVDGELRPRGGQFDRGADER